MGKAAIQYSLESGMVPKFPLDELFEGIVADRLRVNCCLELLLSQGRSMHGNPVPRAMDYAVLGQAQRIRPILAMRIARLLGVESEHVMRSACAVELIHSASLIIDDLPCMDDEAIRRGKPSLHVQFGEPTAILAAFSMVAMAARIVIELPTQEADCLRLRHFQLSLLRTLDCASLVGGQSMDLTLVGPERDRLRTAVNDMKTVPLFQLAVEGGCVSYPGAMPAGLETFGRSFGVAFQLTDDFIDGELHDRKMLDDTYEQCRASLQPFGQHAETLFELVDYLSSRASS